MSFQGSNPPRRVFDPGTLRSTLRRVTDQAQMGGSLLTIPTQEAWVSEGEVELMVRVISSLAEKDREQRQQAGLGDPTAPARPWPPDPDRPPGRPPEWSPGQERRNPFLPYEEALYVADVSDTHAAVLNKFNVAPEHLLVITRAFEHQTQVLGSADFYALFRCLVEYDSLGFYNGGLTAGASQPHKHLQVVPLPLSSRGPSVPLGPILDRASPSVGVQRVPGLPFSHGFCRLQGGTLVDPAVGSQEALKAYLVLLGSVGLRVEESGMVPAPYNLLCTRHWMLLVPRIRECIDGISLNSLAFVGAFLVRDSTQMERLLNLGLLRALIHVAGPTGPG